MLDAGRLLCGNLNSGEVPRHGRNTATLRSDIILDVSFVYVPLFIALAVLGQAIGNRLSRKVGHNAIEYSLKR